VLGGLISDEAGKSEQRVPFLGRIPLIGLAFKTRSANSRKNNLMIFIRPTIVRSAGEARAITEQRYGYARREQLLARPDREPTLDELVRDYLNMAPPIPAEQLPGVVVPAPAYPEAPPVLEGQIRQNNSTQTIRPVELPPSTPPR